MIRVRKVYFASCHSAILVGAGRFHGADKPCTPDGFCVLSAEKVCAYLTGTDKRSLIPSEQGGNSLLQLPLQRLGESVWGFRNFFFLADSLFLLQYRVISLVRFIKMMGENVPF